MTDDRCVPCAHGSDELEDLQEHSVQTGHAPTGPTEGTSGKAKVLVGLGGGFLTIATGVLAWRYKALHSLAAGLVVQVAELAAENDYLKSASGAGKTLNGFRGR
ncbi:hypothetical protein [Streptomyces tricolor]|uniref:hypothetical protein n=1 Tax=Streptomyces tricolor TaxID=68277 RepID=UPI0036E11043